MKEILGFEIIEQVEDSRRSLVYRVKRGDGDGTLIVKLLKTKYPSLSGTARFFQEYSVIQSTELQGIIKPVNIRRYRESVALILEDSDGISLKAAMDSGAFDLRTFLEIAIQLSDTIGNLHQNDIVHKNITPSSIILNPENGKIKLTDFGAITELTHENEEIYDDRVIRESLAYLSPEQTGRMNRTPDHRTDLYSLGVVFYEMLTGRVPFESDDPLGMIYSHIARKAVPPGEIDSNIPKPISDIVMRLVSKTAEDRYQNGFGLRFDLQKCFDQLDHDGDIKPFDLGQRDISVKFHVPEKLVGRDHETGLLISAFDRVSQGEKEAMLVSGHPGIGKTALVNEIHKLIVEKKGYFISGKCEQLRKDLPYSSIIGAFQRLVRHILKESRERIDIWKKELLKALGTQGKVITDVIPEIELIVGKQTDIMELNPEEAQNRFNRVFTNFTRACATEKHPVALFLDDLQWADSASLHLMENLVTDPNIRFLFLIGAYRDNEVAASHPLHRTVEQMEDKGVPVHNIHLSPLNASHVNSIMADFLKTALEQSFYLAKMIHTKSGGNPFFMKQFVETLYEEDLLKLDPAAGWQWDIDKIQQINVTDNVVDLMVARITRLPDNARKMLEVCACIGNRFDLETLSGVLGKSIESTLSDVNDAVSQGLINASDDAYMFHHDRIQEAAYSLISERKKPEVHYRIGRLVLDKANPEELRDNIYYIVNQLNLGAELVSEREGRVELARLNLMAGSKAKKSTAYEAADRLLRQGMNLLPSDAWKKEYGLALELHLESGEVAYLTGDQEQAETFFRIVLKKARSVLDKIRVYEIRIPIYTAYHKYDEALQVGKEALKLLDVTLPKRATRLHVVKGLLSVKLNMRHRSIEELIDLPELTDPHKLATARILMFCVQPAYIGKPGFVGIIILNLLNLTLKNGNSSYAAYAYAAHAAMLCGIFGKIEQGYRFGRLSLCVLEKFKDEQLRCKAYYILGNHVTHWKEHARNSVGHLWEAFKSGSHVGGDLAYTSLALLHHAVMSFWSGGTIDDSIENFEACYDDMKKLKHWRSIQTYKLYHQFLITLRYNAEGTLSIKGAIVDEKELFAEWISSANLSGLAYLFVAKQLLCYLSGAFKDAVELANRGRKHLNSMPGSMLVAEHYFYESLSLLAHYPEVSKRDRKKYMERLRANNKRMKKWAAHAPQNFANKYYLVGAETLRIKGKVKATVELYDKAISAAQENGYMAEESIANELAAKFCLSKGMKEEARGYMQEAHYGFDRWGAKLKVKDLEKEYPDLLQQSAEHKPIASFGQLDYAAIVSSLQAISTEIILEDLLKKLMRIVIENAGAERGFFLSLQGDDLYVEAKATVNHDEVVVSKPIPIQARDDLALSVPNYVRQTMNVVVLDDAAKDGDFSADRYVRHHEPKSILCLPVVRQSKLVGILYLENNVATGAFTPDRIEVLKLLASQAAISIENARLYDDVVRNESELKASEEKYRTILESIEDGYYEVDRSGDFTLVNDSLCRILGYSRNELIGLNYRELMDGENAHQISETFKRVLNTREAVKGFDNEFIRRDGIRINNELSVSLVKTSKGQEIGFRGIVRDITKRKKISEELRMHRDHLEELVKERTTELTKANEKLKREIEARVLAEEELMSYRDHLEELVSKRTAQLSAANEQLRQEIKDRMSAEQEAKLRQEQLFQAAKMASLGTLVSGVAHEINNPISSVMLNAPILQKAWRGVKPILDDHCRVSGEFRIANMSYEELGNRIPLLLSGILEGAHRVKTIVNDLREFSRQSPPELMDKVDINVATKAAIGLVSNLIRKSTNHFSVDYESNMPSIKGNMQRIEQVLINLLVNACQSLGDNQRGISVSTAYDSKLECAVIEVSDQGEGMSLEQVERVKDPFFTTKRDTGGTGLGLAISDRIVSDHGGKIVFESTIGAGTSVKVLLPVSSQKQQEVER